MAPKVSKKKLPNSTVVHRYNLRSRGPLGDSTKSSSLDSKLPSCTRTKKKVGPRKAPSESPSIDCIICLDTLDKSSIAKAMVCGHSFHADCINTWLKSKNTCPVCRAVIGTNQPAPQEREEMDHIFLNTFVAIFMMGYLNHD